MKRLKWVLILIVILVSCEDDQQPKPKAFLALDYPEASYTTFQSDCPYSFEMNVQAVVKKPPQSPACWINLSYPLLKGTIFLTYQPIQGNLDSLLRDAQKLPLQHTIKADAIEGDIYTNTFNDTHGMFYEISGNAASQAQFYLTDSTDHFLSGSVYFNALPNYDSLIPAAAYLKKDMRHLMETVQWKVQE